MGPQNLLSLRFLTHSIFAFEKEVSWRDRKKSYNRYFTAALPHPSSRAGGKFLNTVNDRYKMHFFQNMLWCSSDPQTSVQNLKFDDFLINQEAIFRKRAVRFRISNKKKLMEHTLL